MLLSVALALARGRESDPLVWSKGPNAWDRCAYAAMHTEAVSDPASVVRYMAQCGRVLWVRTGSHGARKTDLDVVAENLGVLRAPVVLVTSDGDRAVPSSYSARTVRLLLDSPLVVRWLTQNYDGSVRSPKLRHIPIGLDMHTPHSHMGHAKLARIAHANGGAKRASVVCDAHLNLSHPERASMYATLRANAGITFLERRATFSELMRAYGEHLFVLSPRGNGLDCHRTWEALLAGCIVITVRSPLDAMLAGFAVVILAEWGELNVDLPRKLAAWRARYAARTPLQFVAPRVRFGYWLADALVVGGTARDCAPHLPRVFARLDALARGRRVLYVFYESNSSDATLGMLRAFVAERDGVVLTERTSGIRTERLARGRNAVIERVERAESYDFFVNLDLDDATESFDPASVERCLARADEWDVATANRSKRYYDLWALRTARMGDMYDGKVHCIKGHEGAPRRGACRLPPLSAWFPELRGAHTFPLDGPYYAVESAFGGLAVYKTSLLRGARYEGTKRGGVPECEHVPFHAAIRAQFPHARIVVAPYLISGP